ncbi:MAG: LSU ribosomal protein L20p [uncultured Thermomicrobiales bacterium]|jgi:large subunit ribosomal protein L20|uniref:Large ribosomal subunit protein bL20 n=1 Tax=uncultured Thermomicrobiales bacterium TaxID=1645740 RepID=A0A6J4V176_9BACT|nr:MAG: LSU ribosomal protein L20p [uncultured Thermomicrobiales bacterium]
MVRVKRGVAGHARHRKVIKQAKGYYGTRNRLFKRANEAVMKALQYAYRDRRTRKRDMRRLWITRINAAARLNGLPYGRFIQGLNRAGVAVDRKILADLAVHDSPAFAQIVDISRAALPSETAERAAAQVRA